jgi:hypothetical protein
MTDTISVSGRRRSTFLLTLSLTLGGQFLFATVAATAAEVEDEEPAENDAEQILLKRRNILILSEPKLTPETVETWVFSASGRSGRRQLEDGLANYLAMIERLTSITTSQRAKIELAGRGDIAVFLQQVDELKRSVPNGQVSARLLQELRQQAATLQSKMAIGLHGPDSLFQKTILTALEPAQLKQIQAKQSERLAAHHEARIDEIIARFARHTELTDEQRVAFRTLLSRRTLPPGQVGAILVRYDQGPFLRSAAQIPAKDFLDIVEEPDRPTIGRLVDVIKLQAAMFPAK